MTYVDGFVLPIKKKNLKAYKKMATQAAKFWKKHGALGYYECVGDDLSPKTGEVKIAKFPKLAKTKPGETVIFAFIIYKSKAHRNSINKKVMAEMTQQAQEDCNDKTKMPFDVRRMAWGGFKTIVQR